VAAPCVVEVEVGRQFFSCLGNALVGFQIDLLVFDASPQPFDKDVHPAPPAVHADGHTVSAEKAREGLRGELRTPGRCS
jgi:hypothetical protein